LKNSAHKKDRDEFDKIAAALPLPPNLREELLKNSPNGTGIDALWAALIKTFHYHGITNLLELNVLWIGVPWLDILSNDNTVCIDEIETSMHPLMCENCYD